MDPLGIGGYVYDPLAEQQYKSRKTANTKMPQPKKDNGNFFTNLIPTGGSIAGAAGGAGIGTMIAPGVGTLVGALLGGALGAGGGKVTENAIEGNKDLTAGVGNEALWGGLTSVGPIKAVKGFMDVGKTLKAGEGLGKAVQAGAMTATAPSIGVISTALGKVGDKASGVGENLIAKQFRLNPSQLTGYAGKHGEDMVTSIKRLGINSSDDAISKLDGYQTVFDSIPASIGNVSKADIAAQFAKTYQPLLDSPIVSNKALGKTIKQQADEIMKAIKGDTVSASDINGWRKAADQATSYTQFGSPERSVVKETADALRSTLQEAADRAGIKTVEGKSFAELGREMSKLYDIKDVLTKQDNLGRGNLPFGILPTIMSGSGAAVGGVPGAIAAAATSEAINSKTGRKLFAGAADKIGSTLTNKAESRGLMNPMGIKSQTMNKAPLGLADVLSQSDSSTINPTTSPTMSPAMSPDITSGYQGDQKMSMQEPQNPFGISSADLGRAYMMALADGDKASASALSSMYDMVSQFEAAQSKENKSKTLSAEASKIVSNAQTGLSAIDTIEKGIGDGTQQRSVLPSGALGGLVGSLLGTSQYDAAKSQLTDIIGRMRSGGAITADEEARFERFLPQPFDSAETAKYKINLLRSQLQDIASSAGNATTNTDSASLLQALGIQ